MNHKPKELFIVYYLVPGFYQTYVGQIGFFHVGLSQIRPVDGKNGGCRAISNKVSA
jgi:hypothetical protein